MILPDNGQRVELTIHTDEKDPLTTFKVHVLEVTEDALLLQSPMKKFLSMIRLPVGTLVEVKFQHKSSLYMFQTVVLKQYQDKEMLVLLQKPDEVTKIQQRKYLRVPVTLSAEIYKIVDEEPSPPYRVNLVDLSGGGFSALFRPAVLESLELKKGTLLGGVLPIAVKGGMRNIEFRSVLLRLEGDPGTEMYSGGMEFREIREPDRDAIVRYCFERQIEMRNSLRG